MARVFLVLLLSLVCISNANKETVDDVGLVQKELYLHGEIAKKATASAGSCDCIGWQDAYKKHGAKCGQGHETARWGGLMAAQDPGREYEFCKEFFYELPNMNMCMNVMFGELDNWCYVSSQCEQGVELASNSSAEIPPVASLKAKICKEGTDKLLKDMKFEEFRAWSDKAELEKGLGMQYAYPRFMDAYAEDIIEFYGFKKGDYESLLNDDSRAKLQAVIDSGKTTFFGSASGHPPFAVVEGKKLYWVNHGLEHNLHQQLFQNIWDYKQDMVDVWCVTGCDATNVPPAFKPL